MITIVFNSLVGLATEWLVSNLFTLQSTLQSIPAMLRAIMGGDTAALHARRAACDTSSIAATVASSSNCGLYELLDSVVSLPMPPPIAVTLTQSVATVEVAQQPYGAMVAAEYGARIFQPTEFAALNWLLDPELSCWPERGDTTYVTTGQLLPTQPVLRVLDANGTGLAGRTVQVQGVQVDGWADVRPIRVGYDPASAVSDARGEVRLSGIRFDGGGGNGAYQLRFEVGGAPAPQPPRPSPTLP